MHCIVNPLNCRQKSSTSSSGMKNLIIAVQTQYFHAPQAYTDHLQIFNEEMKIVCLKMFGKYEMLV